MYTNGLGGAAPGITVGMRHWVWPLVRALAARGCETAAAAASAPVDRFQTVLSSPSLLQLQLQHQVATVQTLLGSPTLFL
jgi:hypothetical protein